MFDQPQHERQAYPLSDAATQLSTSVKTLTDLINEHNIRTYLLKRTRYLPAFEMDRLVLILMRQEAHRAFKEKEHG